MGITGHFIDELFKLHCECFEHKVMYGPHDAEAFATELNISNLLLI